MSITKIELAKIFTDKVAEYLAQGYVFHTKTMNGSDGTTRIDLIKGTDFIRVFMDSESNWLLNCNFQYLLVGHTTNVNMNTDIVWADNLDIIEEYKWIVLNGGFRKNDYYVTEEEFTTIKKKREDRLYDRDSCNTTTIISFKNQDLAKKIVLPFMKKQYKCKSIKLSDIKEVVKTVYQNGDVTYKVYAKGKFYILS